MKMEEIVNPYVASFLERNSFKNVGNNQFANVLCMVTVLPELYKINFTNIQMIYLIALTEMASFFVLRQKLRMTKKIK